MTNTTKPALSASPVGEPLRRIVLDTLNAVAPAVENLSVHQEQCDRDGVMVKVSRQALDEVLNAVNEVAMQSAITTSPASPVAQEPVAWQWRYKGPSLAVDDDGWSVWLPIEYSIESFRETFADKIERGTVEYRPLYAGTPPATPAGLGADEIAQIIATKCFDPRVIDSSGKPFWKKSQWREAQQAANAILALLSRAGDQSNSTQKDGSR